jgi:regulator of protease activity HflC (stomatin/prohibitin superfamily)
LGATLKATPSGWLGAVYRFEKYVRQIGPGLKSVNPFTEKVRLYSSQQIEINPQPQTVTTKDSFTITLNSVAYVQLWDLEILITRFGGKMFKKLKESMAGKNEAKEDETEGDGIINQMIGFFESETRVYGGSRNVELLKAGAVDETWRDGIDKELKRVFGFTLIKFAFTDAPLAENVTKAMNDLLAAKTMAEKLKVESTAAAEKMGIDADANAARVEKEATAEANAIKTVMLAYKANGIEGAQFVAMKIAKEFGPNSKLILGLGNAFKELGLGSIFEKIIK